jgi:glutamine synthetase
MADELDTAIEGKSNAAIRAGVIKVLKKVMKEHGAVVFGGDGYSAEWHKEAVEKRGLANLPTTADALPKLRDKDIINLFESTGVLSPVELDARFKVDAEIYLLKIAVESKLVVSLATKNIYPVATAYLSELAQTAASAAELGVEFDKSLAQSLAANIDGMMKSVDKLKKAMATDDFKSVEDEMQFYAGDIRGLMEEVRKYVDALEAEVADDFWPLPTYQEMLFIK